MSSIRSRLSILAAALAAVPGALSDCVSYGIDFQNEGSYFINKALAENFTAVSEFEGCAGGTADVLLVDPNYTEYICTDVAVTPDDTPQLSSCPILKNQMFSGDWLIVVFGNNGPNVDDSPYAYQRELFLTVGTQVTSTYTSTVTWDVTSTPILTTNLTSTLLVTDTVPNTQTVTSPSATAKKTVTPKPVTSWVTWVKTRTRQSWTKSLTTVTKTKTATCTVPPKPSKHDPTCTYTPTRVSVAALQTGAVRVRNAIDTPMDPNVARRMIREARLRRGMSIPERLNERELDERAPDEATVVVTADTVVNTTVTHTAAPSTTTETVLTTQTVSSTLAPSTVYSGKTTATITAPTPTKTRTSISYTTITAIKTLYKTWTYTTTVTPTASVKACSSQGGHIVALPTWRAV
ncbi:p-loop containing nucleoside triphosphate hydrolase [Diplodia corticola]|uniref:p-loop containing nucleoside triphosphate hydrolase n=1 Tax=Diplodia corticola TaxID=236234 RepID=A0A1J9SDF4_9PEZI|nr:p-loop containing nucleoside triphosphate hydrolase [Diplodia corticola]OJD37605.1 p-loop containing nucleoside triphosphate hydrolase [Diplodia corticola]